MMTTAFSPVLPRACHFVTFAHLCLREALWVNTKSVKFDLTRSTLGKASSKKLARASLLTAEFTTKASLLGTS